MTTDLEKTTNNALVHYQKYDGKNVDLITALQTPLSELKPELRLVTDDGMYVGGLSDLHISEKILFGRGYIHSYAVVNNEDNTPSSMHNSIWHRLFGDKVAPIFQDIIVHDSKKYSKEWSVVSERSSNMIINGHPSTPKIEYDLLDVLRAESVNKNNVALSKELLKQLFMPTYESLLLAYTQMMHGK